MFDVDKIRADFPILKREIYGKPLVYFDNGATAQKPQCVIDKEVYLYQNLNANVHRGVHFLSEQATEAYEAARESVRAFINAGSTREVVFTAGATQSINTVAYSFGEKYVSAGDNVVVSEMEHHSNLVPWQQLCERKGATMRMLPFSNEGLLEVDKLPGLIDERTRIVAVTQASNTLGTRPDLPKIIEMAHAADVPVLVDGCQGVVHGGVDVQALDCDFYAFSGHKLYGPTGIGVLYAKEKWLEAMPPFLSGGDMVGTVTWAKTAWADLPLKFEAGTANYVGAIGLGEAIGYLNSLDIKGAIAHEDKLLRYATQRLSAIDGVRIYGTAPHKCPIVCFTAEGAHPYDFGMMLDKEGVALRTGTHCAEPVMTHYGLTGMARASFAIYNTLEEIDIMCASLTKALAILRA